MAVFDWAAMMRVGMGQLRIPARDFWEMTPAELMLLLHPAGNTRPLGRSGLKALQAHFPDDTGESDD